MPCLRAYAPSGIRTHDPLITSREHEPLHHSAPVPVRTCMYVDELFVYPPSPQSTACIMHTLILLVHGK